MCECAHFNNYFFSPFMKLLSETEVDACLILLCHLWAFTYSRVHLFFTLI